MHTQRPRPARRDLGWIRSLVAACRAREADSLIDLELSDGATQQTRRDPEMTIGDPRVTQHETCDMTLPAISSIWRRSSPTGQKWTRWHPARA